MVLSPQEFMKTVEQDVHRKRFATHPFVQRMGVGEVKREQLRGWAQQMFLQVREFPTWIAGLYANCPDHDVRRFSLMNLVDEERTDKPHPELMLKFGRALGLSRDEMENTMPLPETTAFIDRHHLICLTRPFYEGLAATGIGLERQVPEGFKIIYSGLQSHLGLSEDDLEFFQVHMGADVEHGKRSKQIVQRYCVSPEVQARIREAVNRSIETWWNLYEGSYRAYVLNETSPNKPSETS